MKKFKEQFKEYKNSINWKKYSILVVLIEIAAFLMGVSVFKLFLLFLFLMFLTFGIYNQKMMDKEKDAWKKKREEDLILKIQNKAEEICTDQKEKEGFVKGAKWRENIKY